MTGLSSQGEALLLNTLLAGRFVSLHTADPGDFGTSEVLGGAYARQPAVFVNFGSNPTVAKNDSTIQFPVATGIWGIISHFGIWSAENGGVFYISGPMNTPKPILAEDSARFLTDALQIIVN